MAQARQAGVSEQQPPARWDLRIFRPASAQPPHQVNKPQNHRGHKRNAQERMGKPAMMREAKRWPAKAPQNVQVRSFRRQRQRERGQPGFAIESGATQACASQKMSDGFQAVGRILLRAAVNRQCANLSRSTFIRLPPDDRVAKKPWACGCDHLAGASSVSASGITVISTGSVPSSSPSAST